MDSTDGGKDKGGSQPWEKSASTGKLNLSAQKTHHLFMEERDCLVSWKLKHY